MTDHIKDAVNKLVKSGMDLNTAQERVTKIWNGIKERYKNEAPEFHIEALKSAVRALAGSKLVKVEAVVVGFSNKQDSNGYAKRKAREMYADNPREAIAQKFVAVDSNGRVLYEVDEDGKQILDEKTKMPIPVAADSREFIDKEKKKPNSRWGKPLPVNMQRTIVMITTDAKGVKRFTKAYGNVDPKQGEQYNVFGTQSQTGSFTISDKGPGVQSIKMIGDAEYWQLVNSVAQADPMAVLLGDVVEKEKNTMVVTKGFVSKIQPNPNGYTVILNDDTLPEGIVGFISDPSISKEAESLGPGNEVIITGTTMEMDDRNNPGQKVKGLNIFGFVVNPESDKIAGAVRDMSDIMYG